MALTVLALAQSGFAQFAILEVSEAQFDTWVFQNQRNTHDARTHLDKQLALQTDLIDRACRLSYTQRRKLQLAGRGDIKGFFERVESVRQRFLAVRKDQDQLNELWQEIQPLRSTFQSGLFGDESLFQKTLRNALDEKQRNSYTRIENERRAFHYRAKVELTLATLENSLPLREAQRQKLIELLMETPHPRRFGGQDCMVVLWKLSQVPEDTLRPLFDDAEWKAISRQLDQARSLEPFLRSEKLLETEVEVD